MKTLQTVVTATLLIMSFSVYADYTIDRGAIHTRSAQDVVITLGQDPVANLEATCLALTLGQFLRDPNLNNGNQKVNVTLFLRNDGVALADETTVNAAGDCTVPNPEYYPGSGLDPLIDIPLVMNLEAFIAGNNNNLVNCPICWYDRFGFADQPDYGAPLDSDAIPEVLLGAEKVIDF